VKICKKCKVEYLDIEGNFHKFSKSNDGFKAICKKCQMEYNKKYRLKNLNKIKARDHKYYRKNREKIRSMVSLYYLNNQPKIKKYCKDNKSRISYKHKKWMKDNSDHIKEYAKKYNRKNKKRRDAYSHKYSIENKKCLVKKHLAYYLKNKAKILEYNNVRRKTYSSVRIRENLSKSVCRALKLVGLRKSQKTMELLGCDMMFFKKYIESRFSDGMSWDNYGIRGWHIDHIKPCAAFDLTKEVEQKKCFYYKNLQPMWWYDNLHKNSLYNGKVIRKKRV